MAQNKPYSNIRATGRLLIVALWCAFIPVLFYSAKLLNYRHLEKIPRLFHRGCCKILGFKPKIKGELCLERPTLFVSNHISYTDIFVLGRYAPGSFIAKSEVAKWPILGNLARIQNTLFFERRGKHARSQVNVMKKHMSNRGNLILFPEGTSTEGAHVEPFKSSLFGAAELTAGTQVLIQPVTISYTRYKGRSMSQATREYYAWYGTTPFGSHFFQMAGMHSVEVELIFHTPVKLEEFESRKTCAEHCWQKVSESLHQTLINTESKENSNEDFPQNAESLDK